MNRLTLAVIAVALTGGASPTLAVSTYFDVLRFTQPADKDSTWSTDGGYTTSTQWDTLPSGYSTWTRVDPSLPASNNFFSVGAPDSPSAPAPGSLSIAGGMNTTPYIFGPATHAATIGNYGGPAGRPVDGQTGTRVLVQIAETQGASGTPYAPTGLADAVVDLRLTDAGGVTLEGGAASDAVISLIDSRPNAAGFAFNAGGTSFMPDAQQWLYEFNLPHWTGDFQVVWRTNSHSVFEALRVDTQLVPEPASLGLIGVGAGLLLARRKRRLEVPS